MKPKRRQPLDRMTAAAYRESADEHSLQVAVMAHIAKHARPNVMAFAIPNAGKRSRWAAQKLKAEGMMAGVADLCIMMDNGRTGWLELKTGKGRQSPPQRAFEERCRRLSHNYEVCRDLLDAVDHLRTWGATW